MNSLDLDRVNEAASAIDTQRVVEIARVFCSTPSPSGAEAGLAEVIADMLDRPGIELHVEEVVASRPNVVATIRGNGDRPPLVLNGHLDASVHPGPWRADPADPWIEGNRLHGGGITDMQGGLAAMVAALEAAPGLDPLPGDLVLHAVMHHDTIGLGAKYVLASEGPRQGYGICGEPSDLAIHTGNGGAIKFEIRLEGRSAHVSRREEGIDALDAAVEVYRAVREASFDYEPEERLPALPRLQIGELHAGSAPGSVADRAVIRGDLRTVPGMDRVTVRRRIEELVASAGVPDVTSKVRILAVQKPFLGATSGALIDAITGAHGVIRGSAPRLSNGLPGQAFVTDAADMAAAGLETVVYGVGDWHYAPDESVDIDELADSARVYLSVAATLT